VRLTHVSFFCRVALASLPLTTNDVLLQAITTKLSQMDIRTQAALTKLEAGQTKLEAGQIAMKADLTGVKVDVTYVKNHSAFKPNTVLSLSQVGKIALSGLAVPNEVFSPVEGEPSVLNQEEQDVLDGLKKEEEVVKFLTPRFERIFAVANANLVVVNSERYKWIDTGGDKDNFQKVDLFVCHKALYTTNPKLKDGDRRFGELSNWILRDCIAGIMEAKVKFTGKRTNAVGQIVNYGALLACKERTVVQGVLFDKHTFYFTHMNNGTLTRLVECKWTDAGSETFLRESLYPPDNWMKLLDAACLLYSLVVEPGSFLGYGAHGRVFKVSNNSEEQYAVKLVLKEHANSLLVESNRLQSAYKVCEKHVIKVVHQGENFEDIGGFMVTELGTKVERDEYKRIIEALVALHRSNVTHGDARVNNVVEVQGSIKWIDFRDAEIPRKEINSSDLSVKTRMKQSDMTKLMKSLLQISQNGDLPDDVRELVANYNGDITDNQIQTIIGIKVLDSIKEMRTNSGDEARMRLQATRGAGWNSSRDRDRDVKAEYHTL
jgi:tRNA A-37 threonylcarbamoyl transferase component Bud32